MQRLIIVDGDDAVVDDVLADLAAQGVGMVSGWSAPATAGAACVGVVASPSDAEAALLAAIGGTSVIVIARAAPVVMDTLHDDLRHIGPVEVRSGSGRRGPVLTSEGRAILALLAEGFSLGEAAATLGMSRRTADRRLAEARRSLGVERTTEAIATAFRLGLMGGPPDRN